jgi:hypothetical protein
VATEVDLCNLALSHLGDNATIASINPPEGSAQAEHCARFYPFARDSLLEMHTWGFATKRIQLALLSANTGTEWDFEYAVPNDAVNLIAVIDPTASDDYSQTLENQAVTAGGSYVPQAYSAEISDTGAQVILTDLENAELRYTSLVVDTGSFSPLFNMTLSWHLASLLAGPILKGEAGQQAESRCLKTMQYYLSQAVESDAGQRRINPAHKVAWVSGR